MDEVIWKEIPDTKGLYFMNQDGIIKGPNDKLRPFRRDYYIQTGLDKKIRIPTSKTLLDLFNIDIEEPELHKKRRLFMEHLYYLSNKHFCELTFYLNDEIYYVIMVDMYRQTCIGLSENFGLVEKWLFSTEFDLVENSTKKHIKKSKLKI